MNQTILYVLLGFASGLIVFPIGISIYSMIKNTLERRKIKILIKQGKVLEPIDNKDYDTKTWENQIDSSRHEEELANLNKKLFAVKN